MFPQTNQIQTMLVSIMRGYWKAEHYQNKEDYVPKRIHGQRTITDLPELKEHVTGGEVDLDPVATRDCSPCPVAQLLLRMEREHSQNNSVEVRPGQTNRGVLAWEHIPIMSCARPDKAQLEKHSLVKLRNTFGLEPRSGFDLRDDSRMVTERSEFDRLREWACGRAEVLPGVLVFVLDDMTRNELLHSKARIVENDSAFLVQDMVHNSIEGINMEYPCYLSEGRLLEFMPRSEQGELEAMPNSEDTGVGEIFQNFGDCLLTHNSNNPDMVFGS